MTNSHPRLRVMLVDDHANVRCGLKAVLQERPEIAVIGEAGSVAEAVSEAERLEPDVVVMDLRLPEGSGVEACRESSIAFVERSPTKIGIVNSDGGGRTRLVDLEDAYPFGRSWSPDGSRIAFAAQRFPDELVEIYVINADGSGLVNITSHPANDSFPAWSPDGPLEPGCCDAYVQVWVDGDEEGVRDVRCSGWRTSHRLRPVRGGTPRCHAARRPGG